MGMPLSDFWSTFCASIQASETNDIERKMKAVNRGQSWLLKRSLELLAEDKIPKDFLSDPTNLSNDASQNRFALPSDFVKLFSVYRKTDTDRYQRLDGKTIVTYDQYLTMTGENRFDTDYTGTVLYAAVNEPYLYTDKYFTDAGTDNIKIEYYQQPAAIVAYETLTVLDSTGFEVNESVSGSDSNAVGTIYSIPDSTTINIYSENYTGIFTTETITGSLSSSTTTISSITPKPATLVLSSKYFEHLLESCGLQYHILRGSDEIEARSLSVDAMIRQIGEINKNRTQLSWGISGYVR